MNDNNDKLVFELKDLSYTDLVNVYRDIIAFNEHIDGIVKEVSEVKEEEMPAEAVEALAQGEETKDEKAEGSENTTEAENSNGEETKEENENNQSSEGNNTEESTEEKTEEAK